MVVSPMLADVKYSSITFWVDTPDGTVTVNFIEDRGRPIQVIINFGKSGTSISAWASVTADMITLLLNSGVSFSTIMNVFSDIKTDKKKSNLYGVPCRSGPEGIYLCMLNYQKEKNLDKEKNEKVLESPIDESYFEL